MNGYCTGVDVYHGDGTPIRWGDVRRDGRSFAIIKATEGLHEIDPSFVANWKGAQAAGLTVGAYHFFHADADPTQQAEHFANVVRAAGWNHGRQFYVLDIEDRSDYATGDSARLREHVVAWLEVAQQALGRKAVLYMDPDYITHVLESDYVAGHSLWIADVTPGRTAPHVPAVWRGPWRFWQWKWTGSENGIPCRGGVDENYFNGTEAELRAWVNAGE